VGLAIVEAGDLAPADKAIYALRDTTGTVDSLPLIGSSIVSKKAATGADHLLYDVRRGSGAFMRTPEEARDLARLLVRLSEAMNIRASALITNMDTPLGSAVGNALEVGESARFLRGDPVPEDLAHEARLVAARLLELKGEKNPEEAVDEALSSGAAYERLERFVRAQGGAPGALENLPVSAAIREVSAPRAGHVTGFAALGVGRAAVVLGAGREKKTDKIDPAAGVEILAKPGERVERGDPVARLHGDRRAEEAEGFILEALEIGDEPPAPAPAILDSL
jgi:thymidine phosphorylase